MSIKKDIENIVSGYADCTLHGLKGAYFPAYNNPPEKLADEIIAYIENMTVWHDVKEPPEEDGFYIIALDTDEGIKTTFEFFRRGQWLVGNNNQHLITHWMPLPLPPERSGE
jgi:hypothetical protein